jgi:hypothetical protein
VREGGREGGREREGTDDGDDDEEEVLLNAIWWRLLVHYSFFL